MQEIFGACVLRLLSFGRQETRRPKTPRRSIQLAASALLCKQKDGFFTCTTKTRLKVLEGIFTVLTSTLCNFVVHCTPRPPLCLQLCLYSTLHRPAAGAFSLLEGLFQNQVGEGHWLKRAGATHPRQETVSDWSYDARLSKFQSLEALKPLGFSC